MYKNEGEKIDNKVYKNEGEKIDNKVPRFEEGDWKTMG